MKWKWFYLLEYALQSCSTCKHRHGAVFDSVGISVIIMCMHAIIHGMLAAQLDTCKRFSSMMDGAIKLSGWNNACTTTIWKICNTNYWQNSLVHSYFTSDYWLMRSPFVDEKCHYRSTGIQSANGTCLNLNSSCSSESHLGSRWPAHPPPCQLKQIQKILLLRGRSGLTSNVKSTSHICTVTT